MCSVYAGIWRGGAGRGIRTLQRKTPVFTRGFRFTAGQVSQKCHRTAYEARESASSSAFAAAVCICGVTCE